LLTIGSDADLFPDAATATTIFDTLNGLAHTHQGRQALLLPLVRAFNKGAGRRALRFRVGLRASIRAGRP
jgi:hypothetical protein